MSDRNLKTRWQDVAGFVLILVGGFGAVSIVLFLSGQEPHQRVSAFTWFVVELVGLLGAPAALFFCAALAALGSLLFLRSSALSPARPLAASAALALGFALILGAFGSGGALGAWLPGLVVGFAGRALGAVLGLALCWLGWTLFFAARTPRASSAETVQRISLSARHEAAAGVTPAEAALLVTEPRTSGTAPRREEPKPIRIETIRPYSPAKSLEAKPLVAAEAQLKRGDVLDPPTSRRPMAPPPTVEEGALESPPAPAWEQLAPSAYEPSGSFALAGEEDDVEEDVVEEGLEQDDNDNAHHDNADEEDEVVAEAAERETEPPRVGQADPFATLEADLAVEFELEEDLEQAFSEVAQDGLAPEDAARGALEEGTPVSDAAAPSWEQVGLFDEHEDEEEREEEESPSAPRAAKVDLTPSFDFESVESKKPAHEPEPAEESPAEPFPAARAESARDTKKQDGASKRDEAEGRKRHAAPSESEETVELKPARAAALAPKAPVVPEPSAPPRASAESKPSAGAGASPVAESARAPKRAAEPAVTGSAATQGSAITPEAAVQPWQELVFEAGLSILEQKRVAVSMLERRFKIDFDQACRVLDELQEAGLIGPYMGGRTRDILLTREQWLEHAPQAS